MHHGRLFICSSVDKIRGICYNYNYNSDGTLYNIEIVSELNNAEDEGTITFNYDGKGRLESKVDSRLGITYLYSYDTAADKTPYPNDTVTGVSIAGKYKDTILRNGNLPVIHNLLKPTASGNAIYMQDQYEYAPCEI